MSKYVFVVGGVMSSVGKGIAAASLGLILQSKGYKITILKADPYINVDAGTMNPVEHGEVFVTTDGDETDQDMGNYERFLNQTITSANYMTTGRIYQSVINKERNLEYKGKCVEVIPHIPMEIIDRIKKASEINDAEITLIEIGGTVGEYQNALFLEAIRMLKQTNPDDVAVIMVSYLPIPAKVGEMKTKPTQTAVRSLNAVGIQPDFILGRARVPMDEPRKEKLAMFCNIPKENAISAPDIDHIHEIPLNFEKENFGNKVLKVLNLEERESHLSEWENLLEKINNTEKTVKIGMVGKYFDTGDFTLTDSYVSVIDAIKHACWAHKAKPEFTWINSEKYETNPEQLEELKHLDGVVVPGGFGSRGIEGKILTSKFCRENKIPYFGLCYGMQIAVIDFARNVADLEDANSEEMVVDCKHPVIHIMSEQKDYLKQKKYGGSMRLGSYPCNVKKETLTYESYGKELINERHRHRYEFNNEYRSLLKEKGLILSGLSPDNKLVEIIEIPDHPFFVGTQFHPEFKSRPLKPHPLFMKFIEKSIK